MFKYIYPVTPQSIANSVATTSPYFKRKMENYDAPRIEIEALKAKVKKYHCNCPKEQQA